MNLECHSCAITISQRLWLWPNCITLAYADLPEQAWVPGGVISALAQSSDRAYFLSKFHQLPIQRDKVNVMALELKRGKELQSKTKQGPHDGPGIVQVGRALRRALLKQRQLQGPDSLESKFQEPPGFW